MKKATKFDFKTLLVLLLSFTLCFATVFAACNNANDSSSSSSSSSSTEETKYPSDTQLLKNGDFEYTTFTKKDTDFPVYGSSTNWTRGYASIGTSEAKSNSSKYPDGIIDTEDDAYNAISDKNLPSENPRTPEYYGLVNSDDMYKVSEYENGEGKENEDKKLTSGTKILMIHNHTSNEGQGTARKYTSSSFTLARNQFAELSVWIKTVDLTANNVFGALPGKDYGAYIALESTVSSSIAPVILKNIDTKGNWAKYTMYLSSSDFSTSSYKLVLGLGFGSATVTNEYVQGYAFFDNAHMEIIDRKAYNEAVAVTEENINLYETDSKGLYKAREDDVIKNQAGKTYTANDTTEEVKYTEVKYGVSHTRESSTTIDLFDSGIAAEKNKSDKAGEADFAGSNSLEGAYTATGLIHDETKQLPGVNGTEKSIAFNFSSAATGYSFTTKPKTVKANSYMKLSFWMKAEAKNTYKNFLTATVRDLGAHSDPESGSNVVETVLVSNDNTVDYENDNYNGWKQYVLFVSNTLGEVDRDFEIEFVFGTMDAIEKESDLRNLTKGFAIITAFESYEMSAEDYAIADTSSYSYAKKVSLSADLPNGEAADEDESESFSFNYSESEKKQLLTTGKTETVKGYQFVKAGSNAVGGKDANVYGYNSTEVSGGIVNSKYFAMGDLAKDKTVQAMYIEASSSVAYGFVGTEATLSANTTTYISVDVYASANAIANFYLASSNALNKFGIIRLNPNDEINKEFKQQYTGNGNDEKEWYTLAFLVTTGNESYSYRPEFWLGSRDGETESNGTVYFNNYTVTTIDKDEKIAELTHMGLAEDTGKQAAYTRLDSIIKYNPVNGDTDSDSSSSGEKEVKETTVKYDPTVIYTEYNKNDMIVKVYDYSTYDVEHEIDMTTSDSTDDSSSSSSDSSTSTDPTSFNWALQLTSIIIAAVLIVLLVVILIKTIVEKNSTKKSKSVEYYSRDSRAIAGEKALAKKAENEKKAAEDNDDDVVEEYDYNNPEINNNDKLNGENAAEEANETAEETTETEAAEGTETAENTEVTEGTAEATEESSTENNNGSDAE